jgi:hypothetical protein
MPSSAAQPRCSRKAAWRPRAEFDVCAPVLDVNNLIAATALAVTAAVAQLWETTPTEEGAESDFTSIVKPTDSAAGVLIAGPACSQDAILRT